MHLTPLERSSLAPSRRIGLTAPLFALCIGLFGCGSDHQSLPTAPAPPSPSQVYWRNNVTVTKFEALADGDGIEGAGEFEFSADVGYRDTTGTVYYQVATKSWNRALSTGESSTLNWSTDLQGSYLGGAYAAYVQFWCTEWDADLLGNPVADPDMNLRHVTAVEKLNPGARVSNYITMGTDRCKVRLYYTMEADTVRVP